MTEVIARIAAQRVVPVLRTADAEDAVLTARACGRAGMKVVELTRTTPNVLEALQALRNDPLLLGLGTLTDADQVRPAVAAGARFVVSFAAPPGLVATARMLGATAVPGALTPEEVRSCIEVGAELVKLFPARLVEPSYVRDLRTVMPKLRLMVTGGVARQAADIRPWLDAGAVAVGLGSDLGTVASVGAEEIERRARAALDSVIEVSA